MKNTRLSLIIAAALGFSGSAYAGGYEIIGHSQEGTGLSYVGAVTGYSDGSAAHYNPGALSAIEEPTLSIGTHVVPIRFNFKNDGTSVLGMPATGNPNGEKTYIGALPDMYYTQPLGGGFTSAFSVTSPYGLGTSYHSDWVGRYQGTEGEILTVKTGASLAYAVTDSFSLGATLANIYSEAKLAKAVDFGTIGYSLLGPSTASALGLAPQMNDGYVTLKGYDDAIAWNVGALYRFGDDGKNRIGVAYRAPTKLHLDGNAYFEVPQSAQVLTSQGAFTNTEFRGDLTLPEQVTFGAQYWINDEVAILYESMWNRWSRFENLTFEYENPAQPTSTDPQNWRNTWRHGIGTRYVPGGCWEYRTGFYYDQSPISKTEDRGPLLPTANQYNIGFGATYHWDEQTEVALGFVHTIIENASSYRTGATGDLLDGDWKGSYIQIYSVGLIRRF